MSFDGLGLPFSDPPPVSAIRSQSTSASPSNNQDVLRLDFLSLQRPPETIPATALAIHNQNQHVLNGSSPSSPYLPGINADDITSTHGLPDSLPALPSLRASKTSDYNHNSNTMAQPDPVATLASLSRNYLNMLASKPSQKEADDYAAMPPPPVPVSAAAQPYAAQGAASEPDFNTVLVEMIRASPQMSDFASPSMMAHHNFDVPQTYLTSPLFEDFDPTSPLFGTPGQEFISPALTMTPDLTSPMFNDTDFFGSPLITDNYHPLDNGQNFNDMPLFADQHGRPMPPSTPMLVSDMSPQLADSSSPQLRTPANAVGSFDGVITDAPSLFDSTESSGSATGFNRLTSLPPTPNPEMTSASPSRAVKPLPRMPARRAAPTGTRRNITPQSLIPVDAPTQQRSYHMPSTTARKEVPVTFQRKRAAAGLVDDDEILPDLPPNATEKQQIEWKRRQNTIAARKSRKRKLQHQLGLEDEVEKLRRDRDKWMHRANTLRNLFKGQLGNMEEWDQDSD